MSFKENLNWSFYNDAAVTDSSFATNINVYFNITMVADFDSNIGNFTFANSSDSKSVDNIGDRTTVGWDKFQMEDPTPETITIDGIYIWNGTDCPSVALPSDTLNLSSPLPVSDSSFNVPIVNFNLTYNGSFQTNCSIYLNNTLNQTINEFPAGTNIEVDFDITFGDDGEYNYTIGCWDGLNDTNTSTITFFMDFTVPQVVTDFFNNSFFYKRNDSVIAIIFS